MDDLTYDYINGTSTYVYQRRDMFRVNSDTALLASFMKIKANESVLDIGTNNGALLLHAASLSNGKLYGVDIQEDACELARFNFEKANIPATILCADINDIQLEKLDVIICNPPYFSYGENSNFNESQALKIARHEDFLTLDKLCAKVSDLLKVQGRFYMVHRSERLVDILCTCRKYNLEVKTIQFVYHRKNESSSTVLIEAVSGAKSHTVVLEPIFKE